MVREYVYAYAAVSPHDGVLDSLILPVVSGEAMALFLGEVADRHPEEFILMVLDGAGWHGAANLRVPDNLRLVFMPPYSPELNPAEHLWDEMREKDFANCLFRNLDCMQQRLMESLVRLESDHELVQRLTGFPWIITIPLNAT
jgi:hypothetical protein